MAQRPQRRPQCGGPAHTGVAVQARRDEGVDATAKHAARAAAVAQDADDDDVDDDDDEDMPSARPIVRPSSARTRRSLNGEDLEARTSRPFSAHNRPKPPAMSIAQRDSGTRMAHHLGVA